MIIRLPTRAPEDASDGPSDYKPIKTAKPCKHCRAALLAAEDRAYNGLCENCWSTNFYTGHGSGFVRR